MTLQIGKLLRDARNLAGLTQKQLAKKIIGEIDYTYIGKIERDELYPSLKILEKISNALNLPVIYFFSETENSDIKNYSPDKYNLIKLIRELPEEDVPLLLEIINILIKHKKITSYKISPKYPALKVADRKSAYKKSN